MVESTRYGVAVRFVMSGDDTAQGECSKLGALMSLAEVTALAESEAGGPVDTEEVCDAAIAVSGLYPFGRGPGYAFGHEPCVRIVRGRVFVTQWRGLDI